MVEAKRLYKRFGNVIAVNNVSFEIYEGEIFGLLGPNGAGKTTTIRMLTGILKPDRGEAKILGYDMAKESLIAKKYIGVVPEEANPYPDLTVWDNMVLVGRLHGLSKNEIRKVSEELLDLLGIIDFRDRKAKTLSKGTRQKLLIAMALINKPKVLFLDEPTSGLDVMSAKKIRGVIRELRNEGVTIFLTTHNIEEAGNICDRVAILKKGKIIAMGDPDQLKIRMSKNVYLSVVFSNEPSKNELERFIKPYEFVLHNKKLTIITENLNDAIVKLSNYIAATRNKVLSIQTTQPSFEEVFLRILGEEK